MGGRERVVHARRADGNPQRPAVHHRVPRVDGEIHQHLFELRGIGFDRHGLLRELDGELDVLADQPFQQVRGLAHERIEVERLRRQRLLPAECEELPRQRCRAVGVPQDRFDVGRRARHGSDLVQQALAPAGDHRQDVAEVVGDAARQAAHRFHLLRLPQLVVALPQCLDRVHPLGDVASVQHHATAAADRRNTGGDDIERARAAGGMAQRELAGGRVLVAIERRREQLLCPRDVLVDDKGEQRVIDHRIGRQPEHQGARRALVEDHAAVVHHGDRGRAPAR